MTRDTKDSRYSNQDMFTPSQEATIREAISILETRLKNKEVFSNPSEVKDLCRLKIGHMRDEYFCCLFLSAQHHLISFERLFRGTIDGSAVHPRVVVRRALELNAAAIIFTHNHPSGVSEPSSADIRMTNKLREALALVDVRVIDHLVAGTNETTSMAEKGLL